MSICTLTDTAKQQITTICNENEVYAVTLNLKGGGCAGFEYDWATYKTAEELLADDTITEIDYVKSIIGSSFEIRNPNAQSACGCGVSVNFNLEKVEENAMITELT